MNDIVSPFLVCRSMDEVVTYCLIIETESMSIQINQILHRKIKDLPYHSFYSETCADSLQFDG